METVDVRGLSCPIPVVRAKKLIDQGVSELLIIGDSSVSRDNVRKLAESSGYAVAMKKDGKNDWEMEIAK